MCSEISGNFLIKIFREQSYEYLAGASLRKLGSDLFRLVYRISPLLGLPFRTQNCTCIRFHITARDDVLKVNRYLFILYLCNAMHHYSSFCAYHNHNMIFIRLGLFAFVRISGLDSGHVI